MVRTIKTVEQKKATPYVVKSYGNAPGMIIKDVDTTKRVVTGFYNTFWYFDSDCDVLVPGSTQKSIDERGPQTNAAGKIKHALFHDLTKLPGKIQILEETEQQILGQSVKGLYFETKMSNTTDGNDTLIKYQEGIYDQHSIGFRYINMQYLDAQSAEWMYYVNQLLNPKDAQDAGYMFVIKEVNLYEGSTVAFGANKLTPYLGAKSSNKEGCILKFGERIALIQKQLRGGTLSDDSMFNLELQLDQLKTMIAEFIEEPQSKATPNTQEPAVDSTRIDYAHIRSNLKLSI